MNRFKLFSLATVIGILMLGGLAGTETSLITAKSAKVAATKTAKKGKATPKRVPSWKKPSEKRAYPNLKKYRHAYLYVSTKKQRIYVWSSSTKHKKLLYKMTVSTGMHNATPKGTFHIQNRGYSFYNATVREGAHYWTSFKGWGSYLFHSVPTNKHGKYIKSEAKKLGYKASHGCVRLTVPDAKWINQHVPAGIKVVIK